MEKKKKWNSGILEFWNSEAETTFIIPGSNMSVEQKNMSDQILYSGEWLIWRRMSRQDSIFCFYWMGKMNEPSPLGRPFSLIRQKRRHEREFLIPRLFPELMSVLRPWHPSCVFLTLLPQITNISVELPMGRNSFVSVAHSKHSLPKVKIPT